MTQPKKSDLETKTPESKAREIESNLKDTRGALDQDIHALGAKLSPENLKSEAKAAAVEAKDVAVDKLVEVKDKAVEKLSEAKEVAREKVVETKDFAAEKLEEAKEATTEKLHEYKDVAQDAIEHVGEQARRVGDASWSFARSNAVPLALIGLGATLLVTNGRRSRRRVDLGDRDYRAYRDYGNNYRTSDERSYLSENEPYARARPYEPPATRSRIERPHAKAAQTSLVQSTGSVTSSAKSVVRRVGHEVSELGSQASERASDAYDTAEHAVRDGLAKGRDLARDSFARIRNGSRELVNDNPLALGVLAVATGVGIGMLLPDTERENELYGETRERWLGQARDAAAGVREAVQQGVGDVAKEARSSLL